MAHHPPTWWDNEIAFLWQKCFQPLSGFLVFLLNGAGHWLPRPWQGRFLVLLHHFQPVLPNLLAIGALWLVISYTPQRWIKWVPERAKYLFGCLSMLPIGAFLLWAFAAGGASLLYFLFGWT